MSFSCKILAPALGVVVMTTRSAPAQLASDTRDPIDQRIKETLGLTSYSLQELILPGQGREEFVVRVEVDGMLETLRLHPHSVQAPEIKVVLDDGSGNLRQIDPPQETTYRGTIANLPGSTVTGSLHNGRLSAIIQTMPLAPTWGIQPLSDVIEDAPPATHIVYSVADATPNNWRCGVENIIGNGPAGMPAHSEGEHFRAPDEFLVAEVACDVDYEYFVLNFEDPATTINDVTNIINQTSAIYENDSWIQLVITEIIIRTSEPDPYTKEDPGALLNEFTNHWNANHRGVHRDIAHLFTGKDILSASGGVIGIAWIDAVCSNQRGYALSMSKFAPFMPWRVALTAHEIGHNFNAFHCNQMPTVCGPCAIMCSGVGGCTGISTSLGCSAKVITEYAEGRPCVTGEIPAPTWMTQFGTRAQDGAAAMTTDGDKGLFLVGRTDGDLGGSNKGGADAFITRRNAQGSQIWISQFGSFQSEEALAVSPDNAGGAYAAGYTFGNLSGPNIGADDAFIARYDGAGNQLWLQQFGTDVSDVAEAVAPDGQGGVYIAGHTLGDLAAGNAGNEDVFLARIDRAGALLWILQFGTTDVDKAYALAPDGQGGIYVAGATNGDLAATATGIEDVFLARFDNAGNQLWIDQFGTVGADVPSAVNLKEGGGVLLSGLTTGDLATTSAGGTDAIYAIYDDTGKRETLVQFGSISDDVGLAISSDGGKGVLVAGLTRGSVGRPNCGLADAFVTRFDRSAQYIDTMQWGTEANDTVQSIMLDGLGGLYAAGWTDGSLGGSSAGGTDVFIAYAEGFADSCYGDCDQSTGVNVLDVFDFLCFQNNFVTGTPYACDCDVSTGGGVCDVFDFLCFQNAFVAGCP